MEILNKINVFCSNGKNLKELSKIKCDLELTELSFGNNVFIGYLIEQETGKRLKESDTQNPLWKWLLENTLHIQLYYNKPTYLAIEFMVETESKEVIIKFTK